ncbi:RsmF rRNA methyltransferase first C-terminal domain-containing protein [Streptococcus sp. DD13]|uniref:RsmF rRNA methyltransferase first C-terminal domain-containing protein n=1 Tax=Streptococcus sp. DD13 TaxID=1777881 RepID=UPI00079359CE|nr:RsmB/NOP family class I SAM-dependent RNA methyltransferase [Streptococcus sp. DD13]KXT78646.1 tRNA and rRNA cytosine-C5-methylase [Streptococcus sp. DD13]
MNLPADFQKKYLDLLGDDAPPFLESFQKEAESGFRINPLKEQIPHFSHAIPDMNWSFYGKVSGKSVEHVTGVVYSQEPAAQVVGQVASPKEGMKVLDLAAAPGGKSTHLLSYLKNSGLLVSNEISTKRSKILVENIERFGARNVVVTNESAQNLAKVFPAYFDMIVLDAPCSGEGMFRKDPDAMQYWSVDYPSQCARLQKEILTSAIEMLAEDGELIYSTCTWSPEENEEIVHWLLEQGDFELLDIPKINGMLPGIGLPETARMYPHHFKGEGQFVAKLRYTGARSKRRASKITKKVSREQELLWKQFKEANLIGDVSGRLEAFGSHLYLVPEELPDLSSLKIARNGLYLGECKKNRFEPSYALGIALKRSEVQKSIDLTSEQFVLYVSGNTVAVDSSLENGWYQVRAGGNGLGFAKIVSGTLKNSFPKGLRFQA